MREDIKSKCKPVTFLVVREKKIETENQMPHTSIMHPNLQGQIITQKTMHEDRQ